MGVPGRKPNLDTASAEGKAVVRTGEVGVIVGPPEEISDPAKVIWDTLVPDLVSMGVFTVSDTFLLFEMCEALASAQAFRREATSLQRQLENFDQTGDFDNADRASSRLKRARAGYLQNMKLVMSIAGEFGISPVARLRLGLMKLQGGTLLSAMAEEDDD